MRMTTALNHSGAHPSKPQLKRSAPILSPAVQRRVAGRALPKGASLRRRCGTALRRLEKVPAHAGRSNGDEPGRP
jgi:hypothetical protein